MQSSHKDKRNRGSRALTLLRKVEVEESRPPILSRHPAFKFDYSRNEYLGLSLLHYHSCLYDCNYASNFHGSRVIVLRMFFEVLSTRHIGSAERVGFISGGTSFSPPIAVNVLLV